MLQYGFSPILFSLVLGYLTQCTGPDHVLMKSLNDDVAAIWDAMPSIYAQQRPLHYIEYRNFNEFPYIEILQKRTVSKDFRANHPNYAFYE